MTDKPKGEVRVAGWICDTCEWLLPLNPDTEHGWPEDEFLNQCCPGEEFLSHESGYSKHAVLDGPALVEWLREEADRLMGGEPCAEVMCIIDAIEKKMEGEG